MAKVTGFIEYQRKDFKHSPSSKRIKNFKEFSQPRLDKELTNQAARCMDCGTPFCNWGCPVDNLIPEFNDLVYRGLWKEAFFNLQSTNNFPEFTGKICPAPCEPACCTVLVDSAVTIKQIELAIIEKAFKNGWVQPAKIKNRTKIRIAIIGSGPAGLAAAQQLNFRGHNITVFEKNEKAGGLLRYGIPDFKLEKWTIDRRVDLLEKEGIKFVTNYNADNNLKELKKDFDYICLCCGAEEPRSMDILDSKIHQKMAGIHHAMEFLVQQNRIIQGVRFPKDEIIDAKGRHTIVLGGGDTGSDCIGTGIRQSSASMTQIQLHKQLPQERYTSNPWPLWPKTFSTSTSQEEGCQRLHSVILSDLVGKNKVEKAIFTKVVWPKGEINSGQRNYKILKEKVTLPCDLFLIALGFKHCSHEGLVTELNLKLNERSNVTVNQNFETTRKNIYAAGDIIEGANLVVTAIASGRKMAAQLHKKISS